MMEKRNWKVEFEVEFEVEFDFKFVFVMSFVNCGYFYILRGKL